jgi:cell division protein FtsB
MSIQPTPDPAADDKSDAPAAPEQSAPADAEPATTPQAPTSWARRYLAVPTVIGIIFVAYMAFFGENSITQRVAYQHVIDSLTECVNRQQDTLEYYRDLNHRLSSDPELMEQVVREQYNMKRENEDVYEFITPDK